MQDIVSHCISKYIVNFIACFFCWKTGTVDYNVFAMWRALLLHMLSQNRLERGMFGTQGMLCQREKTRKYSMRVCSTGTRNQWCSVPQGIYKKSAFGSYM